MQVNCSIHNLQQGNRPSLSPFVIERVPPLRGRESARQPDSAQSSPCAGRVPTFQGSLRRPGRLQMWIPNNLNAKLPVDVRPRVEFQQFAQCQTSCELSSTHQFAQCECLPSRPCGSSMFRGLIEYQCHQCSWYTGLLIHY